MSPEKYPSAPEKPRTPEKKERLFNLLMNCCGYEVGVGVERGEEKIRADINRITKKAEVVISPEGIKAAWNFFKRPEVQKDIHDGLDFINQKLDDYMEKNKKRGE